MNLKDLSVESFKKMPLVTEGESKEVRYAGKGLVVIKFKPTIYSFTHNRCGEIPGSDILRLQATKIFIEVLKKAGIKHAYKEITDKWVLAELVLEPKTAINPKPFRPEDLIEKEIGKLKIAPPIETVLKMMHSGTSKHRYYAMAGHPVRKSHNVFADYEFKPDDAYPIPIVRFDWRNPLQDNNGKRLQDEILPDSIADWYIDTQKARRTALKLYEALSDFLNKHDIVCYDLCLFIAEDGETVFGEISQDCGRYRHFDLGSLDKDVWRTGGSHEQVLSKWQLLIDIIGG